MTYVKKEDKNPQIDSIAVGGTALKKEKRDLVEGVPPPFAPPPLFAL